MFPATHEVMKSSPAISRNPVGTPFTDHPPGADTEQWGDARGDQILEGDFDFAETKVCPESKALFTEGHEPT